LELSKIFPLNYTIREEHRKLAEETVGELLCSQDTVDLIEFLELEGFGGATILFDDAVSKLLQSENSAKARHSLLALPIGRRKIVPGTHGKVQTTKYREDWSFDAGRGCPIDELDGFKEALGDRACAQNASLGAMMTLAETDQAGAISSALDLLKANDGSSKSNMILGQLIDLLPEETNFSEINALFPLKAGGETVADMTAVEQGRDKLFSRWAQKDPAAAANYVLEFPDQISPGFMTTIVSDFANKKPALALEWIQTLPEGPHFDNAAIAVVVTIAEFYPKEARDLVLLISDPRIREQQLQLVDGIRARAKGGETMEHPDG